MPPHGRRRENEEDAGARVRNLQDGRIARSSLVARSS